MNTHSSEPQNDDALTRALDDLASRADTVAPVDRMTGINRLVRRRRQRQFAGAASAAAVAVAAAAVAVSALDNPQAQVYQPASSAPGSTTSDANPPASVTPTPSATDAPLQTTVSEVPTTQMADIPVSPVTEQPTIDPLDTKSSTTPDPPPSPTVEPSATSTSPIPDPADSPGRQSIAITASWVDDRTVEVGYTLSSRSMAWSDEDGVRLDYYGPAGVTVTIDGEIVDGSDSGAVSCVAGSPVKDPTSTVRPRRYTVPPAGTHTVAVITGYCDPTGKIIATKEQVTVSSAGEPSQNPTDDPAQDLGTQSVDLAADWVNRTTLEISYVITTDAMSWSDGEGTSLNYYEPQGAALRIDGEIVGGSDVGDVRCTRGAPRGTDIMRVAPQPYPVAAGQEHVVELQTGFCGLDGKTHVTRKRITVRP